FEGWFSNEENHPSFFVAKPLEVDDLRITFVEIEDQTAQNITKFCKQRLHRQIRKVCRSKQFRSLTKRFHIPHQGGCGAASPVVRVNVKHIDTAVVMKRLVQHAVADHFFAADGDKAVAEADLPPDEFAALFFGLRDQ